MAFCDFAFGTQWLWPHSWLWCNNDLLCGCANKLEMGMCAGDANTMVGIWNLWQLIKLYVDSLSIWGSYWLQCSQPKLLHRSILWSRTVRIAGIEKVLFYNYFDIASPSMIPSLKLTLSEQSTLVPHLYCSVVSFYCPGMEVPSAMGMQPAKTFADNNWHCFCIEGSFIYTCV